MALLSTGPSEQAGIRPGNAASQRREIIHGVCVARKLGNAAVRRQSIPQWLSSRERAGSEASERPGDNRLLLSPTPACQGWPRGGRGLARQYACPPRSAPLSMTRRLRYAFDTGDTAQC